MSQAGEIFAAAGWVAWPLLAMSVVSLGLCIERAFFYTLLRRELRPERIARLAATLSASREAGSRSPTSGVIGEFLETMYTAAGRGSVGDAAVLAAGESTRPRLERFLPVLSTVITAAPMLGILGTVTGIIQSFGLLGEAEAVRDTTAMAEGISEALYTTAFGLVIALGVLFPYNAFRTSADRALAALETLGASAIEGSRVPAQPDSASESRA